MSTAAHRSSVAPKLIWWLVAAAICLTAWLALVFLDLLPAIPALEHPDMSVRLIGYLLPPLVLASALFLGQWFVADPRQEGAEANREEASKARSAVEEACERKRFTLEVRGVGLTIDRFRQGKVWAALDEVDNPYRTILPQNPEDYAWDSGARAQQYDKREADAFEQTLNGWVERWPIPIIVAGPVSDLQPASAISSVRQNGGMAIHLFTVLGQRQGEGGDQLVAQLFDFFDQHPGLPAAVVLSTDNLLLRRAPEGAKDDHFVPSLPDSIVALLVTRSDRVDRDIRPWTVAIPYEINKLDTQYDVIQLWNDYWGAHFIYRDKPNNHSFMPWDEWHTAVQPLIARINPAGAQGRLLGLGAKTGFKPNPWVPVRWTEWQMKQYDNAPLLGYLHRPVEVAFDPANNPKIEAANAAAMAEGWARALDTLPEGVEPVRLFYDTAGEGRRVIPLARAFAQDDTRAPLAIDDAAASFDLSRRIGDTGVSSPFVNLALALMRSYHQGGASATVNLREASRASVIMVSPPSDEQKARNPRQPDPFKNPYGPAY